jgi:hypothetical protein
MFSLRMSFAFGRPSCGRALRCVGAPNLRTCGCPLRLRCERALGCPTCRRALRCIGAPNLGEAVLKILPPSQNLFLLRMSFAFGRPSCVCALRCVAVPNLWTCRCVLRSERALCLRCGRALCCVGAPNLRTCLVLRLGAHLADVPCVALGCPTFVRPYLKVYLQAKICSYPSPSSSLSIVFLCVDVFVADEFCVWATILQTCLALRWGAQLADVRAVLVIALRTCVGASNLWTCLALRWGTQLEDVPCVAFGCPSCGRALHCIRAPNLGEAVLKSLLPSQNLFLSILQLIL